MRNYQDLSDAEVVDLCAGMGPGYVGAYLFERAQWVQHERTGDAYVPSPAAIADLQAKGMWRAADLFTAEPESHPEPDVEGVVVPRKRGRPRKER